MKITPCAMKSQPPRISIQECSGAEAGSQAVPEPCCGDGNCSVDSCSIFMPCMESFCALDKQEIPTSASVHIASPPKKSDNNAPSRKRKISNRRPRSEERRVGKE